MPDSENYYQILGVDSDASPEEIKQAFRKKALDYHPDRLVGVSKSVCRLAEKEMKKINRAYEVLKDPHKRRQYDSKWAIPKPVVDPSLIYFTDVEPGEIKRASFIIRNLGGSYNKLRIVYDPNSWVCVVHYESLTDSDELPLRVEIEAEGETWKKNYSEYIRVKLDEEETQVKIDLQTKPEPIREKAQTKRTPTARPTPPPSPGFPISGKWIVGAVSIVAIIATFILMNGRVQSEWNYQTVGYQLWSVAISSDGRYVAAGGGGFILNKDNKIIMRGDTVYLFDQNGDLLWNYDEAGGEVYSVAISSDGRYVAAGTGHWGNNKAYLFNHKGDLLWKHKIGGNKVHSVAISSDGRYVAVGSGLNDGKVYLFNHNGDLLWNYQTGRIVESVAITPDGRYVAAGGSRDGRVCLFNHKGDLLWNYKTGYYEVHSVAISSDGRYVAAGGYYDCRVYLFNHNGDLLWNYQTGGVVHSVAISSDGRYVAAGTREYEGKIYFFNHNGDLLWSYDVAGNIDPLAITPSVAITPDGRYVAAGGCVKVYLFNQDGDLLRSHRTDYSVHSVAISSDGRYVAAGGGGKVSLFTNAERQ